MSEPTAVERARAQLAKGQAIGNGLLAKMLIEIHDQLQRVEKLAASVAKEQDRLNRQKSDD